VVTFAAVRASQGGCTICGGKVDAVRDLRWRKDGYDIVACRSCGVLFRAELPAPGELRDIYGASYFSGSDAEDGGRSYPDYLGEEPNHRANARVRLRLLGCYSQPGRLLDVGCAAGFFLDEASSAGWEVEGVELAPPMADHAREQLGIAVHAASFQELELTERSFDAITMWDYIEHSTDPRGDLAHAAALLRPEGLLALSTGDVGSIAARLSGSRWHLLTPHHHNFFFTRQSLGLALRTAGFDLVKVAYPSSRYSVRYLSYKLRTVGDARALQRAVQRLDRSAIGRWAIPVNLFDIMTVVARRR
jgi:SAM-dependent methyltransferase